MQSERSKIKINEKEGYVLIYVNSKIYSLDVIYSTAYVFLDKAYILLDGDPKKEILIELKLKSGRKGEGKELEKLGREFGNELLNYADYKERAEKTKEIKTILLQRALLTNDSSILKNSNVGAIFDNSLKELEEDNNHFEELALPWEEEYSLKKNKRKKK